MKKFMFIRVLSLLLLSGGILLTQPSLAEEFGNAIYDPKSDQIVVTIFYSGTNQNHDFTLAWDPCIRHPDGSNDVRAQLVDSQERDEARQEFNKRVHLSLQDAPCRPATVTLHSGPRTYVAVKVPAAP